TGLFGVGGGFVIVPALSMILGFPMQTAVGTSLLIIAIVSLGGLLGHVQQGRLDWLVTGLLLLGSGLGMLAGTEVARRIPPARLAKQFAVVAAAVAAGLILHNGIALSWGAR
ncbi:MAG: sulfite exporter TauE/SafE family protein, partial [Nitrospira sp.]|nr:sulfite exporter TauE/SafE family protein [Nitrospira sp.]